LDGLLPEVQSDEIAIIRELLTVDNPCVRGCSVLHGRDLRLVARLPGTVRDYTGPVQTDVVRVGLFFSGAVRMFDTGETNHNGDWETFLLSPLKIAIESHLDWTLAAPVMRGGLVAPKTGGEVTISFADTLVRWWT
jgi:hypothetical protein